MTGYNGYQGRYGTDRHRRLASARHGESAQIALNANKWFEYGENNGYGLNYWNFTDVEQRRLLRLAARSLRRRGGGTRYGRSARYMSA